MTLEQAYFLTILKDHLQGNSTPWDSNIKQKELFEIAQKHQMLGIVFLQLKQAFKTQPECRQMCEQLQRGYFATQFYYLNRKQLFEEVCAAFCKQQLRFFVVKGFPVAELYPKPEMRTMGDVDMVLSPADREKAHKILLEKGFECLVQSDKEWSYSKNGIEFELHTRLIYEQIISDDRQLAFSDSMWDYVREDAQGKLYLEWSYHFVFLLLHLRKHFLNQGVGFRLFTDLAVVVLKKGDVIDWAWVREQLKELGLEAFGETCLAFCERWFGVSSPLGEMSLDEAFFEASTQKIFADGIFGYFNEQNKKNFVGNEIRSGQSYTSKMLSNFFKWFFPGYRTMIRSEQYAFLRGKPFLLPFAWIYRFFYVRKKKKEYAGEVLKESFSSKKEIDARNNLLDNWGL